MTLLLALSIEIELPREAWCDGKSSTRPAATMLASEGDQRSLFVFQRRKTTISEQHAIRIVFHTTMMRESVQYPLAHDRINRLSDSRFQ